MPTHFFHSGMTGAPTNTNAAGSTLEIIRSCLVTGFNVLPVLSATAASGVMTLNYATPHGYEAMSLIRLDGAAGGSIVRRVTVTGANTLTIPAAEFADGAVAGTLSTRVAPADWEEPFSGTGVGVFRSKVVGPGSTRFYYRVADTVVGSAPAMFRGFESMTDANTGEGLFPTLAQVAGNGQIVARGSSATPVFWAVVADQRTCYFFLNSPAHGSTTVGGSVFGDARPYNTADTFAALIVTTESSTPRLSGSDSTNGFCPRNSSGTGSAAAVCGTQPFGVGSGTAGRTYPSPITGAMTFARPVLSIDGSNHSINPIRGERRGIMHCSANPLVGGPFFEVFNSVQGVSGRVVVIREGGSNCVAFPIDEDWA